MLTKAEDRKLQLARTNQLAAVVIILFVLLLGRLWYLQIALGEDLLQQSDANRIKLLRTRAPRGTILDRRGRQLATSRPQFVVMAVPDTLMANKEALNTLSGILRIAPDELESIMKNDKERPGSPVRVQIDVPLETVARIGELRMRLPGVSVELDQIRNYPDGPSVAHIMGYLGEIDEDQLNEARERGKDYRPGDYIGKSGLEKQYEDELRGTDGGKQIEVNAFGRVVTTLGEKASIPGHTLKLTIDRDLQIAADRALGQQVGAVVAINPQDGSVLAMVSKPDYDPNVFSKRVKAADWSKITENKGKPLQNRCVYNVYPPGSTFKPIMAVAGLTYKLCDVNTSVNCPGGWRFGRWFRCWKVHGAHVTFIRAIAESCDVWFYNLGHRLEIDRMAKMARQFGIGCATGIDLPKESRRGDGSVGTMPDTQWKLKKFHQPWWPGETISCAIGQGYVQASPLQMALVTAIVANSGKVVRPHLLAEVLASDGSVIRRVRPEIMRRINAPATAFALTQQGMRAAITSGTGRVCNMKDVAVCGKSGSAEDGKRAAHGWFECFAPMDKPTIAVACIVEHGRHGATSAAPVCRAILDVYFGKKKPQDIGTGSVHVSGD